MASPSTSLATLRPELGSLMEFDLEKNRAGFIAYQVLPIIGVSTGAGKFGRIPTEQLGKLANVDRNSSGGYNRINFTFTDDSYATQEHGLEGVVDQRNANLYANYFDAELATARLTLHSVLAKAEKRVADAVFNTSTWNGASLTTAVGTAWSNKTTSSPVDDVRTASQKVRDACGQYADTLVINRKVFRNLQDNTQVRERITSVGAGSPAKASDVTKEMLAQVFDVDRVIVADSAYDNAIEGQTTTFTDIWSASYAMVCILGMEGQGVEIPCIGRTFHWDADGSTPGGTIETYYEESVRGDVVRVRHDTQEKIIYPETGHLLSNIT